MAQTAPLARTAFSPGSRTALTYLQQQLAKRNVDVGAADAVFGQEGASGGVGDGGHAFGPGQFNDAGGVWTGRYPGMSPAQKNALAWSPPGLAELADRVGSVAGGLKGPAAINAIVSRFERPADPRGEISRALAAFGQPSAGASDLEVPTSSLAAASAGPAGPHPLAAPLAAAFKLFGLKPPALHATAAPATPLPTVTSAPIGNAVAPDVGGKLALASVPQQLETRPGIQVDQRILPAVEQIANRFGVDVNSGFRSPEHNAQVGGAQGSDHLRGDAVDFTGPAGPMQALYRWAQGRFPYVEPRSQTHGDHVHISFIR